MLLSDRLQRYGVIGAALAVVILMALLGVTLAQDATGTTEGRLGVPGEVVLGELFDVVGYEVVPSDVEVKVEYSGHFALEGESCGSPSAGASPGAVAPTWVTLQACSVGEGWVRLVASDTGAALDEVNVAVSEPGATGQAAQVSIGSLGSSLEGAIQTCSTSGPVDSTRMKDMPCPRVALLAPWASTLAAPSVTGVGRSRTGKRGRSPT